MSRAAHVFSLEIECDNAAFDPNPAAELARILSTCAVRLDGVREGEGFDWLVFDINGNRVGTMRLEGEE